MNKFNIEDRIKIQIQQQKVLNSIIEQIGESKYFKNLNLNLVKDDIINLDSIPLTTYEDYEPYIEEILNKKENVLSKGNPIMIFKTGGSSGKPKLIPQYLSSLKQWPKEIPTYEVQQNLINNNIRKFGHVYEGASLIFKTNPNDLSEKEKELGFKIGIGSSFKSPDSGSIIPEIVSYVKDYKSNLYISLLFSIKFKGLDYIFSTYIHIVKDFLFLLKNNWNSLLEDIRDGKVNCEFCIGIKENILIELKNKLGQNIKRYEELCKINIKKDKSIGSIIWKNMVVIQANCSNSFTYLIEVVKSFFNKDIKVIDNYYVTSESLIGTSTGVRENEFELKSNITYIEFLPSKITNNCESRLTVKLEELVINNQYQPIITTSNGLVRYKLDDIIEIKSLENLKIIFKIINKVGWRIRISSENFDPEFITSCIYKLICPEYLAGFSLYIDYDFIPSRYVFLFQLINNGEIDKHYEIEDKLQEILCENVQYKLGCDLNKIGYPPKVKFLKNDSYDKIRIKFSNDNIAQFKFPLFLSDQNMVNFIKNLII